MTALDWLLLVGTLVSVAMLIAAHFQHREIVDAQARIMRAQEVRLVEGVAARTAAEQERDAASAAHAEVLAANQQLTEDLATARAVTATEVLTPEQRATLLANACAHCGGVHARACPRVKRLQFGADGRQVIEVEFWRDGRWDETRVKWIEDLSLDAPASEAAAE